MARAFSSSRRPPPKAAVKPSSSMALSRVPIWSRLRLVLPSSTTTPLAIASSTLATISRTPSRLTQLSRVCEHLGEVVAGVDLQHRERDLRRVERLLGQPQHDDGVLAAGEHQDRLLELGRDLAEDVDRLRLQLVELAQPVVGVGVRSSVDWETSRRDSSGHLSYRRGRGRRRTSRLDSRVDRRGAVGVTPVPACLGSLLELGDRRGAEHRQALPLAQHAPDQRDQDAASRGRSPAISIGCVSSSPAPSGAQPALSSSATPDMVSTITMPRRMNDCGTRGRDPGAEDGAGHRADDQRDQ